MVSLSNDHFCVCECAEPFNLNTGTVSWCDADIVIPFLSRKIFCSVSIQSNVKQTVLPLQCSITQRPAQHDTLHPLRPDQTPFDHTHPDRCLYTYCRQNIKSSQLVLEVANCSTVEILIYFEFIFNILCCINCLCVNILMDVCMYVFACVFMYRCVGKRDISI